MFGELKTLCRYKARQGHDSKRVHCGPGARRYAKYTGPPRKAPRQSSFTNTNSRSSAASRRAHTLGHSSHADDQDIAIQVQGATAHDLKKAQEFTGIVPLKSSQSSHTGSHRQELAGNRGGGGGGRGPARYLPMSSHFVQITSEPPFKRSSAEVPSYFLKTYLKK